MLRFNFDFKCESFYTGLKCKTRNRNTGNFPQLTRVSMHIGNGFVFSEVVCYKIFSNQMLEIDLNIEH